MNADPGLEPAVPAYSSSRFGGVKVAFDSLRPFVFPKRFPGRRDRVDPARADLLSWSTPLFRSGRLPAVSWGMFFVGSVLVGKKGAWPAPVAE